MSITGAFACSHAGLLVTREDRPQQGQASVVRAAFAQIGEQLRHSAPDAIVVVATDHGRAYSWANVPQLVVGVGASARGLGDAGIAPATVPVNQPAAQYVLGSLLAGGVDACYSEDVRIDHSFMMPLSWITPDYDLPIVPIVVNCGAPPLMTLNRCRQVGAVLGAALRADGSRSYAVLGTGGLSHWTGDETWRDYVTAPAGTRFPRQGEIPFEIEDTGPINTAFDRELLDCLGTGDLDAFLSRWDDERIAEEAGNGAREIRNWLLVAEAVAPARADLLCYEAINEWLTGTAVVSFQL